MTRKRGRGASNQPFFRRSAKPMYYGNADSIEITPYFEGPRYTKIPSP